MQRRFVSITESPIVQDKTMTFLVSEEGFVATVEVTFSSARAMLHWAKRLKSQARKSVESEIERDAARLIKEVEKHEVSLGDNG